MKVKDLKPAAYNPRKISKEKLAALKKSLEEFGDLFGIVYNTRTPPASTASFSSSPGSPEPQPNGAYF